VKNFIADADEIATKQNPIVRPTTFPEDIKVGKDAPRVAAMSSEIASGGGRSTFAVSPAQGAGASP